MNRENQLKFCRKCTKQKFDLQKGIICGVTDEVASFEDNCELFEMDSSVEEDKEALISDEKPQHVIKHIPENLLERFRAEQNLLYGFIGGLLAAIMGALLWAFITISTEYQIGYMAIAVGLFVGVAVRYFGNGIEKIFGIIGAILAFLGCFLGNFLSTVGFIAAEQSMGFFEILLLIDINTFFSLIAETFNPIDLLFYGLAIYEGYRFSFRKISSSDIEVNDTTPQIESKLKPRLIFALFIIISFGIITFIRSENGIKTYYYESGEKMSEGIMNYGRLEGKWTYWYENGQIQTVGNYIKDKEDSIWIYYSLNNIVLSEGNFKKGMKDGKWDFYYDDGSISHTGIYKDDRVDEKWNYYYQNGNVMQEMNYIRDHLNGEWTSWYEEGSLHEKGFLKEDLKVGEWTIYHLNGTINEELIYNNDTVNIRNIWDESGKQIVTNGNGEYISYFDNEIVSTKGKIINGKPKGLWITRYEDGKKKEEQIFENNTSKVMKFWTQEGTLSVKDGNGKYYLFFENGRVQLEGNYQDGLREGEWRSFYENADDLEKNIYKHGKLNGLYEAWYENGVLQVSGNFINDKREGEWIWYSENGNITSIANFINGKKEGTQKFWNNFNTLLKEEIYKNGELVKVRII